MNWTNPKRILSIVFALIGFGLIAQTYFCWPVSLLFILMAVFLWSGAKKDDYYDTITNHYSIKKEIKKPK